MNKKPLIICILAAGKGSRMNSSIPKVIHEINGTPMILDVIKTAKELNPQKIIVIVGYKKEMVISTVNDDNIDFVIQKELKGTAHAVQQCENILKNINGNVLILSGDVPLIKSSTLNNLIDYHILKNSKGSLISANMNDPFGYGRIIRDQSSNFVKIVEQKDANNEQQKIQEINSGIYIFDINTLFSKINLISNNNNQNEYYLTDIFDYIKNEKISIIPIKDQKEISGINTIKQLEKINEN
tara:strand:+ start:653 stop:1375 length:723 start_codon:yes stop_codon:yes gene_type:complete